MYKTMQEIENEYDGNWVFMINCREGGHSSIIGGEVIYAGKDKKPIKDLWMKSHNKPLFRYIGNLSDEIGGYLL